MNTIMTLAKIFNLSLILCLPIIINAEPQESRAKEMNKDAAGSKRTAKPAPLTAREDREAERRLADLGYWTGPVDGRWDEASRHALIAFQKVEGLKRTGRMTRAVFDALVNAVRPTPLESGPAHIEVDLIRQVLFQVDETGTVTRILPVSTGSGKPFKSQGWVRDAITHPGRYKIYIKLPGWKKSPLGMMYYPNYFMYATAIHGYQSVPTRPASHGCIRIPMFAAKKFYRDVPMGMPVIVHKGVSPKPAVILSGENRN